MPEREKDADTKSIYPFRNDEIRMKDGSPHEGWNKIVLGTWGLGGVWYNQYGPMGYGTVSVSDAFAVFHKAWSSGVRSVDISPVYGAGESIRRLALWQQTTGCRFQPVMKVGRPLIHGVPVTCLNRDKVFDEISAMASMLGDPAVILIKDPPKEAFVDGKIRSLLSDILSAWPEANTGISSHSIDLSILSHMLPGSIAQLEHNGINWPNCYLAASLLKSKGWRIWGAQPLANGFLSGKYNEAHQFPGNDWRSMLPAEQKTDMIRRAHQFNEYLSCFIPHQTPPVMAIAFCLSAPYLDKIVVGPKSEAQWNDVKEAIALYQSEQFRRLYREVYAKLLSTIDDPGIQHDFGRN